MEQVSPVSRRIWYAASFLVFIAIFISRSAKFVEPDFFMHLRIGEWIVQNRTVPRADIFSHVAYGRPWTDHEWLFQVFIYGLYKIGGWTLLAIVRGGFLTASYFFTLRTCRLVGLPWGWSLSLTLIAASMAMGSVEFRPQVITYFLFPLYFDVMLRYLLTEKGPLWLLPVLIIPWANMHGAFVAVFVLGALLLSAEIVKHLAARFQYPLPGDLIPIPRLMRLGLYLALAFLATVINPYGTEMWFFPFKVIQHPIFFQMIFEWMPPEFPFFAPFWITVGIFLALLIPTWRHQDFRNVFLVLAWTYLSLSARRNIVLFGYVAAPLFGQTLWQFATYLREAFPRRAHLLGAIPAVFLYLYAIYLVYAVGQTIIHETVHEFGIGINSTVPVRAADFVSKTKPAGEMFNEYNVGGYLIYRLFPEYKVFQDGRVDVYGPTLFYKYKVIESGNPKWRAAVQEHNLNMFFLTHGGINYPNNLASQLDDDGEWDLVYFDDVSLIYVRNSGPNRHIAKEHAYRYIKPGYPPQSYLNNSDAQTSALKELDRAIAAAPEARLPRMLKLYCLTNLGHYDEASSTVEELVKIAKNKSEAFFLRGQVFALQKEYQNAIDYYQKALSRAPQYGEAWLSLGDVYEATGQNDKALHAYLKAAKFARIPDVKAYMCVARVASRLGDDELAMRYWDKYLEYHPTDVVALNDAGTLCLRKKHYARAVAFFKKAIEIEPSNPAPYYNLSCAYIAIGQRERALDYLHSAIKQGGKTIAEIAQQDADLLAIRTDPSFAALITEAMTTSGISLNITTPSLVRTGTHEENQR